MTTDAQLTNAIGPLLLRHDDLVLHGRFLLIKPVGYLWRSVRINTSVDPDAFVPQVAVGLLATRVGVFDVRWGKRLYRSSAIPSRGEIGNQYLNNSESTGAMLDMLEREVLPELRAITSATKLLDCISTHCLTTAPSFWADDLEAIALVIMGKFDAARALLEKNERMLGYTNWQHPDFYPALLSNDRARIAATLREWEALVVRSMRLEHLWEFVPFEFELINGIATSER